MYARVLLVLAKTTAACVIPAAAAYGLMCIQSAEKIQAESSKLLLEAKNPHGHFWWAFNDQAVAHALRRSTMTLEQISKELVIAKGISLLLVGALGGILCRHML